MRSSTRFSWVQSCELCFGCLVQLVLIFCLFNLQGCSQGQVDPGSEGTVTQSVVGCTVSTVRYPTSESEFSRLYAGRGFLTDDVHIGRDINLAEGTAIYPIACGTIRIYRAAEGYGTLVVVIEHHLAAPIMVVNGVGERVSVQDFLSIYGHLRATTLRTGGARLPFRDGDTVRPEQAIGYVQNAADNGDGEEHLHLGIRLQAADASARTDPTAWFAGYDRDRVRRRWYADPAVFLSALLHRSTMVSTATWHPPGTILSIDGQTWLVASEGVIVRIPDDVLRDERFGGRVVAGVPAEVACMTVAGLSFDRTSGHRLIRFEGNSTVYEYADAPSFMRYTFLAQQAFDSWGWRDAQIEVRPLSERAAFLVRYRDVGSRRLREGSLVKAAGRSDVYVVSQGQRRPIFDWPTFLALGYDEMWIIEVDSSVLDVLAGSLGEVIRPEDLRRCRSAPMSAIDAGVSLMDVPLARDVPAGVDAVIDATVDAAVDVLRDVPTGVVDAGVPLFDAGRDTGTDLGIDVGRTAEMDASVGSIDAANCTDPPLPPQDAGVASIDAGNARPDVTVLDVGVASVVDVALPDAGDTPPPAGMIPPGAVMRYEFRLATDSEDWRPTEPYNLRNHWWERMRCVNAGGADQTRMVSQGAGWFRCDTSEVYRIFVGTFFSPSHPMSGDVGNIPTVDAWPTPCYPRPGAEWRISELPSGRELYHGPASGLPCVMVGSASRHQLP